MIIINVYLVFIPVSGCIKPLEFPMWWEPSRCLVNEVTWKVHKDGGWLPGKLVTCIEGWPFVSPFWPWEGREAEGWISNGQWLISHDYVVKSLYKPKRMGFRELPGWWTCGDAGRVVSVFQEHGNFAPLFPSLVIHLSGYALLGHFI